MYIYMTKKICPQCLTLIGEDTRTKIIKFLKKEPKNVGEIAGHFSLTQPTISHHLKVLKKMGMVLSRKSGRKIYYSLNTKYPCRKCFLFKIPFKT